MCIGGRAYRCRLRRPVGWSNASGCFQIMRAGTGACRSYAGATGFAATRFMSGARARRTAIREWFKDRSHAPLHCPQMTDGAIAEKVIAARRRFPYLGPRKLLFVLERERPGITWPAASTIGEILKRAGLVTAIKRRRRPIDQRRRCTRQRGRPTTNGRQTSRAGFAPSTSSGLIRSPLRTVIPDS